MYLPAASVRASRCSSAAEAAWPVGLFSPLLENAIDRTDGPTKMPSISGAVRISSTAARAPRVSTFARASENPLACAK